jgi:hypothetical protein
MKKVFLIKIFAFLVSCGGSSSNLNNPVNTNSNNLITYIIPLYSYPVGQYQSEWEKLYNLNTSKCVYVIINPDNGPGNTTDANCLNTIIESERLLCYWICLYKWEQKFGRRKKRYEQMAIIVWG